MPIVGLIHGSGPPIRRVKGIKQKFYNVKHTSWRKLCSSMEEFQKDAE